MRAVFLEIAHSLESGDSCTEFCFLKSRRNWFQILF